MMSQGLKEEDSRLDAFPAITTEEIMKYMHAPGKALRPVIRYTFQDPGKRLRSRLLYLSAQLTGRPSTHLTEAAALVEMLHNGTLLHDDVIDHASTRRNRPTVNRLWGEGTAIMAGDFLLAATIELAVRLSHPQVLPLTVHTLIQLVDGQVRELQSQGDLFLPEKVYMDIIEKKTASLFSAACKTGIMLSGGTQEQIGSLDFFGRYLGIAFQLLDDIQDYKSLGGDTGKQRGKDLAEKKVTLPLLKAFQKAGLEDRERIMEIFSGQQSSQRLDELVSIIERLGGFSYGLFKVKAFLEKALSILKRFPENNSRQDMEKLIQFLGPKAIPSLFSVQEPVSQYSSD